MTQSRPLSAAQRAKIRRLSAPRELSPDEEGGELNIVPFLDIIVNILIFVLATVAVTFTTTIETTPPASNQGAGVRKQLDNSALNLTVLVVSEGFSLKASGGNIAPGCETVGPGIAVPKRNGQHDFRELNRCVAKLKSSSADFEDETQASIAANPGVDYATVIGVMDALRNDSANPSRFLFPNISFKVPR